MSVASLVFGYRTAFALISDTEGLPRGIELVGIKCRGDRFGTEGRTANSIHTCFAASWRAFDRHNDYEAESGFAGDHVQERRNRIPKDDL
jgi:hypothetical protein